MRLFLTILALAYAVCPYDLLPDWLVGFGWLDDISILVLLWWYFYRHSRGGYGGQGRSDRRGGGYSSYQSQGHTTNNDPRGDPFQILGIDRKASQSEIRHAYKELANKYHPDKVSHLGKEFQALAERRFREIQEAYEKLKIR